VSTLQIDKLTYCGLEWKTNNIFAKEMFEEKSKEAPIDVYEQKILNKNVRIVRSLLGDMRSSWVETRASKTKIHNILPTTHLLNIYYWTNIFGFIYIYNKRNANLRYDIWTWTYMKIKMKGNSSDLRYANDWPWRNYGNKNDPKYP
jgi:hypothetical protein